MKKVKINEQGFVESPYISDASIERDVDDELYVKLMTCNIGMNWRLIMVTLLWLIFLKTKS